ncbi:MAG: YhbY family RNA-binding protein [archaeon]|nr:YhbY family RNA-binding protein [archaeon]
MKKLKQCTLNIGKNGVNDNFIELIRSAFKNHENVRVCILKSGGRDREKKKEYSDEIIEKLGNTYTSRIVGFTIFIKKWRKPVR